MEVPRGMEPTGTNGRTRHTLSDPPWGLGLVLWWFSRWMARNAVSCGHDDDTGKAFDLLASVVRFPDRHDRNRSCGWFRCRPIRVVGRLEWFCGGHGPGETPGPFPNPEAKAWHGDGTALERVWESSAPPHSFVGGSRRASAPGTPFFMLCCAGQPAGARCPRSGRLFLFPVGSVCFGLPKGIFVVPQRLLVNRYFFRNVLLTRYMIRFSEYGLWDGIGKDGNDVPEHRSAACTM